MSSRDVGALYAGWLGGSAKTRQLLLSSPWVYLKAQHERRRADSRQLPPARQLLSDLDTLGSVARRAHRRLVKGLGQHLSDEERQQLHGCCMQAKSDSTALFARMASEGFDAG